ncbi:MAG: tetratricopeptide repeat protein [Spirochaetales bacterium]|nr:tetratricopeptide repeat protein [Spirochaetales bacterium]
MNKYFTFILILSFLIIFSFQNSNAVSYYQNGLNFEEKKEYLKAIEQFLKAIELNPNYFDAYYHLASCYFLLEKYEEANDIIQKGLRLEYEDNPSLLLYAKILIKLGDLAKAEGICDSIINRNPTFLDAYFLKAEIKIYQSKISEAFDIYSKLLRRYPDDWKVNLYLYKFYQNIGKDKESLIYLRKALDLAPYEPAVFEELSYYYFNKNDIPQTEEFLQRLFELDPKNPQGLFIKAYILIKLDKFEEASNILQKLYEIYPTRLNVLWLNSYLAEKLNNYDKAIKLLSSTLTLFPYDEMVRFYLEELIIKANQMQFYDLRSQLAEYNFKWANFFFSNGFSLKGEILLRRAVRLMPMNTNYRWTLSEMFRSRKAYFKQLEQYNILKDLGYSGISTKIDVLTYSLRNSLENKYKIKPYSITDSFVTLGIFAMPSNFREDHYNINLIFSQMLFDKLASIYGINLYLHNENIDSLEQIAKISKEKNIDYAIIIDNIEPVPRNGYRIYTKMINPDNLYTLDTKIFYASLDFPILEISLYSKEYINSIIPCRGKVLDAVGSTVLVNIGYINGITKDTEFIIINKNQLKKNFNSFGFNTEIGVMATAKIKELSETCALLEITKKDIYSKVNIGDFVFIAPKKK